MNIEKSLKEIGEYFKNKILNGDFDLKDCSEYSAFILIDKKHKFDIWIGNSYIVKDYLEIHRSGGNSINNTYIKFTSQKQRLQVWKHLKDRFIKERDGKDKIELLRIIKESESKLKKLKGND